MVDSKAMEEKSTSDVNFRRLWQQLTHNQRRFAVAMLDSPTKKDAAIACQLEPNTVYKWNGVVDEVVEILLDRAADSAYDILEGQVVKAAMVKVSGLDSADEKVRQAESTEILDRVLGRARQSVDVTTDGESLNEGRHSDDRHARAMVSVLEAFREGLLRCNSGESGAVDAAEHAADGGAVLPSG